MREKVRDKDRINHIVEAIQVFLSILHIFLLEYLYKNKKMYICTPVWVDCRMV